MSRFKILFISPEAFGYHNDIKRAFEKLDAEVTWLNQIPNDSTLVKAVTRFFPKLASVLARKYFNDAIDWDERYDYVLVIKGEALSPDTLIKMKSFFSSAEFIFYNWDSFRNSKGQLKKTKYFDRVLSFDPEDCEKIDEIDHLPLFYSDVFSISDARQKKNGENVGCFVGTLHSNRYEIVENISALLDRITDRPSFRYYFYQSKVLFFVLRFFKPELRSVDMKKVKFKSLNSTKIANLMLNSRVIIDICHTNQTGLTMRTFEALGMKRKLITNNKSILKYEFYNANNICLIDVSNPEISQDFVLSAYEEIDESVYEKYSVNNWVRNLLGL